MLVLKYSNKTPLVPNFSIFTLSRYFAIRKIPKTLKMFKFKTKIFFLYISGLEFKKKAIVIFVINTFKYKSMNLEPKF